MEPWSLLAWNGGTELTELTESCKESLLDCGLLWTHWGRQGVAFAAVSLFDRYLNTLEIAVPTEQMQVDWVSSWNSAGSISQETCKSKKLTEFQLPLMKLLELLEVTKHAALQQVSCFSFFQGGLVPELIWILLHWKPFNLWIHCVLHSELPSHSNLVAKCFVKALYGLIAMHLYALFTLFLIVFVHVHTAYACTSNPPLNFSYRFWRTHAPQKVKNRCILYLY